MKKLRNDVLRTARTCSAGPG